MIRRPHVPVLVSLSLTAAAVLALAAPAFALNKDQQACVNGINKAGAKVATTQGKDNSACIKAAGSENLINPTTDDCVIADNKGKVQGAESKTIDTQASKCGGSPPSFGYTSAATVNTAAISEELALLHDVFGNTVHTAMLTDNDGAGCQASVSKSYEKLGTTRLKAFNACKKTLLKDNPSANAINLQACTADDTKQKVSGARTKLGETVVSKCDGVTLATAFPGCSAQAGDATALTNCIARKVECRMCLMTNAMDGISTACDTHDDGLLNATCRQCGNSATESPEACDTGGNSPTCDSDCTNVSCGDGLTNVPAGETCDTSGQSASCDDDCSLPSCGDGNTNEADDEDCDDGNPTNGDGCDNNCTVTGCGNTIVTGVEDCDDGNTTNTDPCLNSCESAACGDTVVCSAGTCTTGPTGGAEQCDDGDLSNTDSCLTNCASATCGDGNLCSEVGCTTGPSGGLELCDNGGANSNVTPDACRTTCRPAFCGDSVTDTGETCDGGGVNTLTCDSNCTSAACGDGFVNGAANETCDGGGETVSCDANCTAATCGDGTLNATAGEDCDDSNTTGGDGCSATCQSGPGSGESDPACPNLGELTLYSHDSQIECDDNTDCAEPRTCDTGIGYCTTVADLDSGWTGTAHNSDINDGITTKARLICEGPASPGCGECEVAGIDPEPGNCRCTNNVRTICDDPFSNASSDCPTCAGGSAVAGVACLTNVDCNFPTCTGRCSVNLAITCTTNANCTGVPGAGSVCSTSAAANASPKCANGKFCSANADCMGSCTAQAGCECFFGAPFPLNSGGTAACIVNRFANDISGTANVDLGAGEITANLRTRVYLGITQQRPCPVCAGKCSHNSALCLFDSACGMGNTCNYDTPNDGIRDGLCNGGLNSNQSCDASGFNATFPAITSGGVPTLPGGGYYSIDCQPSTGINVSGTGLAINLVQTTGFTSMASNLDCDGDDPGTDLCACMQCSKDKFTSCQADSDCTSQGSFCNLWNDPTTFACDDNADCTAVNTGTCTASSNTACSNAVNKTCTTNADCGMQPGGDCVVSTCTSPGLGVVPQPNKCNGGVCDDIGDGFNGRCATGPDQGYCDGLLRIDGRGIQSCGSNIDCTNVNAGACTLSERQLCFLEPIEAQGDPDPEFPVAGSVFCVPPTENSSINAVAGLPGPGRVISQGEAKTYCSSNNAVQYTPGGVPACP